MGTTRASRTDVAVGGSPSDPTIRVARLTVQVLTIDQSFDVSSSSSLVFGQTAAAQKSIGVAASSSLVFGQEAVRVHTPEVTSSLVFGHTAVGISTGKEIIQNLVFGHGASSGVPTNLVVTHNLVFGQSATPGLFTQTASNNLILGVKASPDSRSATATSVLIFDLPQYVCGPGQTPPDCYVANHVVHLKAGATAVSAAHSLVFGHKASPFATLANAASSLVFSQTADDGLVREIISELVFSNVAAANFVRPRDATHSLVFGHLILMENEPPDIHRYTPVIAGGTIPGLPTPPAAAPPAISRREDIQLFWPTVSPTLTLELKLPDKGDRDLIEFERILRESRTGDLDVYADEDWQTRENLVFQFVGLQETDAQALLSFIQQTLGELVGFTDWENRTWQGYILSSADAIVRNGPQGVDVTIEYAVEGEL